MVVSAGGPCPRVYRYGQGARAKRHARGAFECMVVRAWCSRQETNAVQWVYERADYGVVHGGWIPCFIFFWWGGTGVLIATTRGPRTTLQYGNELWAAGWDSCGGEAEWVVLGIAGFRVCINSHVGGTHAMTCSRVAPGPCPMRCRGIGSGVEP